MISSVIYLFWCTVLFTEGWCCRSSFWATVHILGGLPLPSSIACPCSIVLNAEQQSRKQRVPFLKSLVWLGQGFWITDLPNAEQNIMQEFKNSLNIRNGRDGRPFLKWEGSMQSLPVSLNRHHNLYKCIKKEILMEAFWAGSHFGNRRVIFCFQQNC